MIKLWNDFNDIFFLSSVVSTTPVTPGTQPTATSPVTPETQPTATTPASPATTAGKPKYSLTGFVIHLVIAGL